MDYAISHIPAASVVAGDNDRKLFDEKRLRSLAKSIEADGLVSPPVLRPLPDGRFEIVAGERRFRAMSGVLGWDLIPAIVRDMDDGTAADLMLAENVHRENLRPMEEARAYASRMETYGWSIGQVAERAHVSESLVRNRIALLSLTEQIQDLIDKGHLPLGFGVAMSVLDPAYQTQALRWVESQNSHPTQRALNAVVNRLLEAQSQMTLFDITTFYKERVRELIEKSDGRLADILPTLSHLPDLPDRASSVGQITDLYICALLDNGHVSEAAVLMDFWAKMLSVNSLRLAASESRLLNDHPDLFAKAGEKQVTAG